MAELAAVAGGLDVAILPVSGWGLNLGPGHMDAARRCACRRPSSGPASRSRPLGDPAHPGGVAAAPAAPAQRGGALRRPGRAARTRHPGGRPGAGRSRRGGHSPRDLDVTGLRPVWRLLLVWVVARADPAAQRLAARRLPRRRCRDGVRRRRPAGSAERAGVAGPGAAGPAADGPHPRPRAAGTERRDGGPRGVGPGGRHARRLLVGRGRHGDRDRGVHVPDRAAGARRRRRRAAPPDALALPARHARRPGHRRRPAARRDLRADRRSRAARPAARGAGRERPDHRRLAARRHATTWRRGRPAGRRRPAPRRRASCSASNADMPAFRWYEKDTGRMFVSNLPRHAAALERRQSHRHRAAARGRREPRQHLHRRRRGRGPDDGQRRPQARPDRRRLLRLLLAAVHHDAHAARRPGRGGAGGAAGRGATPARRPTTGAPRRRLPPAARLHDRPDPRRDRRDPDRRHERRPLGRLRGLRRLRRGRAPLRASSGTTPLDTLRRLDHELARLARAAEQVARPYRFVVLSDHGQSQGATFRTRYGVHARRAGRHGVPPAGRRRRRADPRRPPARSRGGTPVARSPRSRPAPAWAAG